MLSIGAHENANFSGLYGVPIAGGPYNDPLTGTMPFQYNRFNRLMAPTMYTHPVPSNPNGVMRGWQKRPKK